MFELFGTIKNPLEKYGSINPEGGKTGLVGLLNNVLRLIIVVAGIFAFFQLIIAGFNFISAGGDPEAVDRAWKKIWQALLGLTIVIISFLIAMLVGQLLFGDPQAILNPQLYGPGI